MSGMVPPPAVLVCALCLVCTACDDGGAGSAIDEDSSSGGTASGSTAADTGPSGQMVEGAGVVYDLISGDPVEGAEVCLFMEYDFGCVFSDGSGAFSLPALPAQALRATQVQKQGHAPIISWFTVPAQPWSHGVQLMPQAVNDALVEMPGGGLDTSRGHIVVRAVDGSGAPVAGATLELVAAPDAEPAFLDGDGLYDPMLEGTSDNGIVVVPNLAEGPIDVKVLDSVGDACSADAMAESGEDPSTTRLRILAGHWASAPGVDFVCN